MKQRWLVAIIGLPALFLILLVCPPWATMLLVCAMAGVAAYELLHTAAGNVGKSVYAATIFCAVAQTLVIYNERKWALAEGLIPYGAQFQAPINPQWILPWILVMLLFFLAVQYYGTDRAIPFSQIAVALVAGVAFPMMYSCIFLLRYAGDFGRVYVLAPFFIAFAGDSFSMFGGMLFGRKKMAPAVSPHKTWAGGIAGPVGSALAMLLLGLIGWKVWGYTPSWLHLACVGAGTNVLGQLGDLSMSLIKREAGVKDYSHLFLTHGGMLDRFDSTLFIAPVVYLCVAGGFL